MKSLRSILTKVGISRTSAMMALGAGLLLYHGEDSAQVLAESVGHEWTDILVTKLVKFTYVVMGLFILSLGLKPLYHLADGLTHYDTSIEIERGKSLGPAIVMATIIGAYLLGGCIFLGMVFQP